MQNPKEALILCNQEEKLSSRRMHAKSHGSHVWKHKKDVVGQQDFLEEETVDFLVEMWENGKRVFVLL